MKKIFFLVFILSSLLGFGQSSLYFRGDTVFIMKGSSPNILSGNNELNLFNGTRNKNGAFLQNYNHGRTRFMYAVDSVWKDGDSLVVRRGDTTIKLGGFAGSFDTTTIYANLALKLNKTDTAGKWVTSVYRKTGTDSVFYIKGGSPVFAFKDSVGLDTAAVRDIISTDTTFSPLTLSFKIGSNNSPLLEGDSTYTNALFAHKFIILKRDFFWLDLNPSDNVTYDSATGKVGLGGPLVNGETIYIEARYTSNDSAVGINGVMGYGGDFTYDSDAQAFFDAEATAGNTMSLSGEKAAWNTFITGLKSDGNWTAIKGLYFEAFGNFNYNKINARSPGTLDLSSTNGTITYNTTGADPNGSNGYINTGINPTSVYANDNYYVAVYSTENTATTAFDIGAGDSGGDPPQTVLGYISGAYTRLGLSSIVASSADPFLGFILSYRSSSTNLVLTVNGSQVANNTTSTSGRPNVNMYQFAYNDNGGTPALYSDRKHTLFMTGAATGMNNTKVSQINTRVEALMDYYGLGVQ